MGHGHSLVPADSDWVPPVLISRIPPTMGRAYRWNGVSMPAHVGVSCELPSTPGSTAVLGVLGCQPVHTGATKSAELLRHPRLELGTRGLREDHEVCLTGP